MKTIRFRLFSACALFAVLAAALDARPALAQDRLCDTSFEDCRTPLLNLIRSETRRIDAAFWFMSDARYSNEIVKRWQAGVDVRIIVDPAANDAHPGNAAILQQLEDAGIPMRRKIGSGILHWKMMLFDAQNKLEFSSANYSPYGFLPDDPYRDYEDEVIYFVDGIESPSVINSFRTKFEDLWTDTTRYADYANITTPPARFYPIWEKDSELNFPPIESYRNRAIGHYNAETLKIDVSMFRITDRTHTDAIIKAAMRGIPVRLLSDKTEYRNEDRLWHAWNVDRLYMAGLAAKSAGLPGIDVRLDAHQNVMHQKSVQLYSQGLTIFGSSNWTSPSAGGDLGRQEEHNYFTTRVPFFNWFRDQFERKWNNTNPVGAIETEPFVPLGPDKPALVSPADLAAGVAPSVELAWFAGPWGHLYDIYLGTDPANLTPIAIDVELGPSEGGTDYQRYTVGGLNGGTTYYWRIVSKTMARLTRTSDLRRFTTAGTPTPQPTLPAPWASADIGATLRGSAGESAGTFTVQGAGADIWNSADAFHFVYRTLSGDGTVTARVATQQNTDPRAKAGVMMRETLDADSANASMLVTPARGLSFQRRVWTGATSTSTGGGGAAAPYWVRLVRQGNTFSGYVSPDGQNWTLVETDTILMADTIYVGLPVSSHESDQLGTATFDNVSVVAGSGTPGVTLVRHPYLQQVTSDSAIVVWTTEEPGPADVRYWTGTASPTTVAATSTLFSATTTGLTYDYYQHEARISGLAAATTYSYDIFVSGTDATEGTDQLTTAPPSGGGTVRFIAFGDSGTGSAAQRDLAAAMRTDTFDFALHTGDVVYGNTGGTGDASYQAMDEWFFAVYRDWLRSKPVFPSLGNHDSRAGTNDGEPYLASFVLPENGGSAAYPDHAERYYSFDYGPVHFVALDTELAFQDPARRSEQLAWLEADLAATTQPWKVVFFHRPPYSAGAEHGSDLQVRQAFGPILEEYGVQLAITGHEHDYERTLPQRTGTTGSRVAYVVTGGGGAPLYPAGVAEWTAFSASAHHYVRTTADTCTLLVEAVGLGGVVLDTARLSVCDPADTAAPSVGLVAPADGAEVSGTTTVSVEASDNVGVWKVGLYVDGALAGTDLSHPYSFDWNTAALADGDHTLEARAYDAAGNAASSGVRTVRVSSSLPAPWQSADVGAVGRSGSAASSGGTFTVTGSGADIWDSADAFHFVYQPLSGDGEIVARVATIEPVDRWTKAGVMMRETLDAGSRHALMLASVSKGLAFQRRPATNGPSVHTSGGTGTAPYFVKLARQGSAFTASVSPDGSTWTVVGSETIPMAASILVGLAVSSHNNTELATATFDGVSVASGGTPGDTTPPVTSITSPANGAEVSGVITVAATASDDVGVGRVELWLDGALLATDTSAPYEFPWDTASAANGSHTLQTRAYDAAANAGSSGAVTVQVANGGTPGGLPAPWAQAGVGSVNPAGTASASDGTFTIEGAGADVWGTADAFHYVYQPMTGNAEIVARVASVENVDQWTKAGVMMRESLDAGSRHAFMLVSPGKGLAFQRRTTTNGTSTNTSGGSGTAPAWVKLVRTGSTFSAYRSGDGVSWTLVGSDAIPMGSTILVGLAVSSHRDGTLASAVFDGVDAASTELPAPWAGRDIGAVGRAGSGSAAGPTLTVSGSGADIWGTADAFYYVYQPFTGDGEIVARVATLQNTDRWAKAGVMMRESLDAGAAHAAMFVSAEKGLAFQRRVTPGGESSHTSGGAGTAPRWVRLVRSGATLSAYVSTDGASWTLVGTETISMETTIYVGLAVTAHDNSALCAASFDSVTVTGS